MLQTLKVLAVVLGFIIVAGSAYLYVGAVRIQDDSANSAALSHSEVVLPLPSDTPPLVVTDSFSKGSHTVSGTITLPNPCYFMDVSVEVLEGEPQVATLTFTTSDEGGICVQVIDEREFSVTFEAREDVLLKAIKDGAELSIHIAE